jgi:hypothetical protein
MIPSPTACDLTSAAQLDERSAIVKKKEHQMSVKCSKVTSMNIAAQQQWP